jgi:hypothetical protein
MAASERALGILLDAHAVLDVHHKAALPRHLPKMADVHSRQQLIIPPVLWDGHSLVKGVPAAHSGRATQGHFAAQGCGIGAALGDAGLVHLLKLVNGELLFEEPLRVHRQIRDGPGIKILEILQPLRVQPQFDTFALGRLFAETTQTEGCGEESVPRTDGNDAFCRTVGQCTGFGTTCTDDGICEVELREHDCELGLHDGLSLDADAIFDCLNAANESARRTWDEDCALCPYLSLV